MEIWFVELDKLQSCLDCALALPGIKWSCCVVAVDAVDPELKSMSHFNNVCRFSRLCKLHLRLCVQKSKDKNSLFVVFMLRVGLLFSTHKKQAKINNSSFLFLSFGIISILHLINSFVSFLAPLALPSILITLTPDSALASRWQVWLKALVQFASSGNSWPSVGCLCCGGAGLEH